MNDVAGSLLRRLRLRHLELLDALGELGTVHAAARRLNLSQPAVSKMLGEIEQSFGNRLFDRSKAGVRPNRMGLAAIRRARIVRHEIDAAAVEVAALSNGAGPLLRLGTISVTSIVPEAIVSLRGTVPGIIVHIVESPVDVLLGRLLGGELDCVFGALSAELPATPAAQELASQAIYRERICVVASPQQRLARRARLTWRDLQQESWALPPLSAMVRQAFVSLHLESGLPPPVAAVETLSPVTMSALVRADPQLIGIMRSDQVRRELREPGLVELPVRPVVRLPPLSLFTRRASPLPSPLVARFAEALRKAARPGTDR